MVRIAVFGWRLGLGWLLGRRWLLMTTSTPEGGIRYSLHEYRFYAGSLYVPSAPEAWERDLTSRPRAMTQTHPGPLAVRARPPNETERCALGAADWVVLEPTTEPTVGLVEPDLAWWVVPAAVLAVVLAAVVRTLRR